MSNTRAQPWTGIGVLTSLSTVEAEGIPCLSLIHISPSEDPNKMLDIWYKKVKETNNFSCLYDDIDRAS